MTEFKLEPYSRTRRGCSTIRRTEIYLTCPFCAREVLTYLWSLCGSGKRCPCGALLLRTGALAPEVRP